MNAPTAADPVSVKALTRPAITAKQDADRMQRPGTRESPASLARLSAAPVARRT